MTIANKALSTWTLAVLLGVGLAGCERQGPFERAGEEVDETVEDVREGVDDAADEMRDR